MMNTKRMNELDQRIREGERERTKDNSIFFPGKKYFYELIGKKGRRRLRI